MQGKNLINDLKLLTVVCTGYNCRHHVVPSSGLDYWIAKRGLKNILHLFLSLLIPSSSS